MITMSSRPSRWLRRTAAGYARSATLVAVAGIIPALTIAVAVFGLSLSRSWSAHLHALLLVRLVAAIGEWAIAALWTVAGFSAAMTFLGRPTAQLLRRYRGRWLGAEIPSPYRPPRAITQMSTGYWWDGHTYQETEREAKTKAWLKQILREQRASSVIALDQLRTLVRGINPPVLVERGLVDAIRALALDAPIEVNVRSRIEGRPEQPVEAALYFAVAELLTNVVKHSHATHAAIELSHGSGVVRAVVSDDGTGGATATPGSGLDGIARRLAAFEGRLDVYSPTGGPTAVSLTVPCELS
jgi:hypothetical protein